MAGIAGIMQGGKRLQLERMLASQSHRGPFATRILEHPEYSIGIIWSEAEDETILEHLDVNVLWDGPGYGQSSVVDYRNGQIRLSRDPLGVSPLYYTMDQGKLFAFASEVKALSDQQTFIYELRPGHRLENNAQIRYYELAKRTPLKDDPRTISEKLLDLLLKSISRRINSEDFGIWLSDGLASATTAALANPFLSHVETFAAGVKGSPELTYAKEVASYLGTRHHEVLTTLDEIISVLPEVIFHLESIDVPQVRAAVLTFLLARTSSGVVRQVISGEGLDSLLAGFPFLKSKPPEVVEEEMLQITSSLHNTVFQRIDRCVSAYGLVSHLVFSDPELVEFSLKIPASLKIHDGIDHWLLRSTMDGMLPDHVLRMPGSPAGQETGIGMLLADYAESVISDFDFRRERKLPNGWELESKEAVFYYKIFRDFFPGLEHLDWMGRTPVSA